jgi:serine/threonine protein kinase
MLNPIDRNEPKGQDSTDPKDKRNDKGDETRFSDLPTQFAAPTTAPEMPAFIGPYRVIAFLGRGGQGTVFRAAHPTLARDVVIKLASRALSPVQQECLFAEGRVLARFDDSGLIRVYDANVHEGRPYLVFEFVRGRSLDDLVRGTSMPPREAVSLVASLATILERVHTAGVLHRDLKPTNVLIDSAGNPRLMDFGSALLKVPYTEVISEEELSGTPSYMSPEQANSEASNVGPPSDVFGLAGILYYLLTGSPPYPGTNSRVVWELAKTGRIQPVVSRNPATPRTLAVILDKGLAADPAERYQSAAEFGRALHSYLRRPIQRLAIVAAGVALLIISAVLGPRLWQVRDVVPPSPDTRTDPVPVACENAPRPRLKGWREYQPRGEYAVLFPTEPKLFDSKTETKGHPAKLAQSIDRNGTGFAVAISPHRDAAPTKQAALRARRDEMINFLSASLTSEREITHEGFPGAEASALVHSGHFQGYWLRLRVFLVRDQFYSLAVMGRDPHYPDDVDANWFFDSFRVLKPED